MREVLLRRLRGTRPEDERAATAGLAERVARERGRLAGALQLAALEGGAVTLGRDQAARPGTVRRPTGGHTVFSGSGVLAVSLILPGPAAWLDASLPSLDRLSNRMVRGLLGALHGLGFDASYPGQDIVRARNRSVAYLSCERDARGVCLVQAWLGVTASPAPERLLDWPGGGRSPLAGAGPLYDGAAESSAYVERTADAIALAYQRRHALRFVEETADAAERAAQREWPREARSLALGPERAIPIGTLRAGLRLSGEREIEAVEIASEWIADSPGVAALERGLAGAPLAYDALVARAAPVIADPAHFFLGAGRAAENVAGALLDAAGSDG